MRNFVFGQIFRLTAAFSSRRARGQDFNPGRGQATARPRQHNIGAIQILLIFCLGLAGCALRPAWHWERPGASEADYRRDEIACKQQSYEGADGAVTQAQVRRMQRCLENRGWRKVAN